MLIVPKFTDYSKSFSHMIERNKQFLDGAFDLGAMIAKWEHHEEVKSPEKVKEVQYIIKINLEFYLNVNFLDDVQSCSSEKNKAVIDVKIKELLSGHISLKKGKYSLDIKVDEIGGHNLSAPVKGQMTRYIKENIAVPSKYTLFFGDEKILEEDDSLSSCEWMWD